MSDIIVIIGFLMHSFNFMLLSPSQPYFPSFLQLQRKEVSRNATSLPNSLSFNICIYSTFKFSSTTRRVWFLLGYYSIFSYFRVYVKEYIAYFCLPKQKCGDIISGFSHIQPHYNFAYNTSFFYIHILILACSHTMRKPLELKKLLKAAVNRLRFMTMQQKYRTTTVFHTRVITIITKYFFLQFCIFKLI